jgi:hypothetical protein
MQLENMKKALNFSVCRKTSFLYLLWQDSNWDVMFKKATVMTNRHPSLDVSFFNKSSTEVWP